MPTRHADPIGHRTDQRPQMELMLRQLPAQHRDVLVATYFSHRTTHEAARLLGLSPEAAKFRVYQAMRALSDMLSERGPAPVRSPKPASSHRRDRSPRSLSAWW
ncbi:sigma factor-like helix-turn-helix DNA-binding protein [Actinoplanes sp. M2I2]|uniref:sigma factor-like helix-turn-helix DNA-binding protein n=1 Tax=Actinoplanes sp. M2I2 TaxID=1734444 RepID=UPI0027E02DB9|nr:sigma factor-like helix-turn-helix DNA-binding protein [Actinoplanes sp. M2I2]